ncbi:MAG: RNA methyltransferase [bacterium]|nr:RNA methyltransferase [bacterium]
MPLNYSFILVSPRYAGNVGSAARAVANMGFKDLRLVAPRCSPKDKEAVMMAMGGSTVLKKVKIFKTIPEAIADRDYLIGTSCTRAYRKLIRLSSRDLVTHLEKREGKIAVLFGPEEKGLSNEDLSYCDQIVTIPTSRKTPSLNLAQSVLILAYELSRLANHRVVSIREKPASKKSLHGMIAHLEEILWEVGYMDPQNPFRNRLVLRNLFRRAQPTEQEIFHLRAFYRKFLGRIRSH